MKKLFTPLLILFFASTFSQSTEDYYGWMVHGKIKKEMLAEAKDMFDVVPNYPKQYFGTMMDYVSVGISTVCDGKILNAVGPNEILTTEQKNNLIAADLGSDIIISIKFSYKDPANDVYGTGGRVKEFKPFMIMIVPETEAQFPGGNHNVVQYIKESILNRTADTTAAKKAMDAILNFTVDEEGKVMDVKLSRSSRDGKLDELILEAANKMPKWNPAQNAKGIKVKQAFSFPVRRGAGC
jgi:TonB family protein